MIWGKRRFEDADYGPYMDKLDKLLMDDTARADQYTMVSTENAAGERDYYVGVPDQALMQHFDGFTPVKESDLPKEINATHLDAGGAQRFFTFKKPGL